MYCEKPFTDVVRKGSKVYFKWCGIDCFSGSNYFPPKQVYPRNAVNFEDRVKICRAVLNFVWKGLYDYSKFEYSVEKRPSKIICRQHGAFIKTYDNHVGGQGCLQCSREQLSKDRSQGFGQFITKAKEVHGERYIYPKQVYTNIDKLLVITCRIHGNFTQTAYRHVNKQNGCNKCSVVASARKLKQRDLGGWSKDDYCKLSPKSNLYVVHMQIGSERFYKIGISKNLRKRFNQLKRDTGVEPTLMLRAYEDSEIIWDLEKHLHTLLIPKRYKPTIHFVGHTECFANINIREVHKELLKFIDTKLGR